ncbi:hypothetical protein ACF064_27285 [Streptomyces sp. NPDC015492]|uniref:HflX-like GTP-binding protein n=1 Tax=Streptomyces sp. NPDC015492 TaxID=3364958 RepID=UPI0036FF9C7D
MHKPRRDDRRQAHRAPSTPAPGQTFRIPAAGADVVLVGYFSARQKDFETVMASAATALAAHGAQVVARIVQRRGVSAGGAGKMGLPYSSRTLLSYGKVREVALRCEETDAAAVVFTTPLTGRQRRTLTAMLGRPATSISDVLPAR